MLFIFLLCIGFSLKVKFCKIVFRMVKIIVLISLCLVMLIRLSFMFVRIDFVSLCGMVGCCVILCVL